MKIEQEIKKIVFNVRTQLVSSLTSLDEYSRKSKKQQIKNKLKIVLQLITENNKEQALQQLVDFDDSELSEIVKNLFEKNGNNAIKSAAQIQTKPSPPKNIQRRSQITSGKEDNRVLNKSKSLFKGMFSSIIKSNQKEAKPMILPKNQPKCVYDPIKKIYVIQGQEQKQEQAIPKPPPKKTVNKTADAGNKASQKKSQIEEMMAPPAFKRKGGPKKEQTKKPKQVQITFQVLQQKLSNDLEECVNRIIQIFKQQFDQKSKVIQQNKVPLSMEEITVLRNISEQIRSAQQISDTMLTRLYSSYIDSEFENQTIGRMINTLAQLEATNTEVLNLFWAQKERKGQSKLTSHIDNNQKQRDNFEVNALQEQVKKIELQNEKLQLQLEIANKGLADQREKYKLNLSSQLSENSMIKTLIDEKRHQIQELNRQNSQKDNLNSELNRQLSTKKQEIRSLKNQISSLKQKFTNFETTLHKEQKKLLENIIKKSSQVSLMEQLNEALIAQNELFLAIQAKRISISTQGKQPGQNQPELPRSNSVSLLQLSDSLSKVVQHYQKQISSLKKQVTFINQNYQISRTQLNKMQQNLGAQNQSLQRSLTRMKSLIQDYKQSKQQLEIKLAQTQNQNLALQRQITHIRKQHNYTKQVLEQNIRSSHDNTATMKQQLQEEIKQLEDKLEEKQINQRLQSQEIKECSQQIRQLIGQNKSKSIKLANVQKDMKSLTLELDQKQLMCSQLQQKLTQTEIQVQSIKKKLSQQKSTTKSLKSKIKQLQQQITTSKQQIKQQNRRYSQQVKLHEQIKKQNQQLLILIEQTNKQKQQAISNQQKDKLVLQEQLEDYYNRLMEYEQYRQSLEEQTSSSTAQIENMKKQLADYKVLYNNQCTLSEQLLAKLSQSKRQTFNLQQQMQIKISKLLQSMEQNQLETEQLSRKISEYERLTKIMGNKIQELQRKKNDEEQQLFITIEQLQQKNKQYLGYIATYKTELQTKTQLFNKQKQQLQADLRSLSEQLQKLTQKVQQQNAKTNANKQSQQLIKQLSQKCSILEEERNSFQQITFQMQKQISELEKQITNLTNQLNNSNHNIQIQRRQSSERFAEIAKRDEIIEQMKKQAENKLNIFIHQVQEKQERISILELKLKHKEQEITKISEQLKKEMQQKQRVYEDTINDLVLKLDEKQEQITKNTNKINSLEAQLNKINISKEAEQKNKNMNKNEIKLQPEQQPSAVVNAGHTGINIKNQLIHNIQSTKDQMNKLNSQLEACHTQIAQYKETILANARQLEQLEVKISQKQRHIQQLQIINKKLQQQQRQYKKINQQLQDIGVKKLTQTQQRAESSQQDPQELQMLIILLEQNINQKNKQIQGLEHKIYSLQSQLNKNKLNNEQLSKQKLQLEDLYAKKSDQAEKNIEKLQIQNRELKKLQTLLHNLESKYRDLELQNNELVKEKIQILKTRDQILNKLHSLQRNQNSQPGAKTLQSKQNSNSKIKAPNQNAPISNKKISQIEPVQQKPTGFFGSLSSLFLTQTQLQKIGKVPK